MIVTETLDMDMFNMVFMLVREECSNVVHDLFDIDIM